MKKILSILLSVAMLMTILPATLGFAADPVPAKYTLMFRDINGGDIMPNDKLVYQWTFNSGEEYVNNFDFNFDYDAEYLTPLSLTGKVLPLEWEAKPEENKIAGFGMTTGNSWTKETTFNE